MRQQQKDRAPSVDVTFSGSNSGNSRAKNVAAKAAQVLEEAEPKTFEERWADALEWLKTAETVPDIHGDYGHESVMRCLNGYTLDRIKSYAEKGDIDLETMSWTKQARAQDQMICFCLVPACRIGHFIPIRGDDKKGK